MLCGREETNLNGSRMKILFLDIDGPMIPDRANLMDNHLKLKHPIFTDLNCQAGFDPVAVGMINKVCNDRDYKIVLHSSWIRIMGGQFTKDHCISQGVRADHFHDDAWCNENENWRYSRIVQWLVNHPEMTSYVILDDTPYEKDRAGATNHPYDIENHLILISTEDGLSMKNYRQIVDGNWNIK